MENKKIGSFTGLRFIMIMVIVFSHFDFLNNLPLFGPFYLKYLKNPAMATDFFFLLSGFGMMLGSINRQEKELLTKPTLKDCFTYGIMHIKQIYPVYIITICVGFIFKFIWAINDSTFNLNFLINNVIKLFVNALLLQSATGMMFFTHAYNGVSWFLSSLFCIYLVSPLLIFILRKTSKKFISDLLFFIFNIAFAVLTAFIFSKIENRFSDIKGIPDLNLLVYASPYRRVFYVLCGMNLAMIFDHIKENQVFNNPYKMSTFEILVCIPSIILFLFRKSIIRGIAPYFGGILIYFFDITVCAIFILIFAFDNGIVSRLLNRKFFQRLGSLSMYIFLIHPLFIVYPYVFVGTNFGFTKKACIIFSAFILFFTFFFSILAYKIQNRSPKTQLSGTN